MKLTDHQDLKTVLKYENTSVKALKEALTKSVLANRRGRSFNSALY